jgi:O-antigen/teichoic acid export membrane protein
VRQFASVPVFFALRVGSGLLLLKLSASFLSVSGFAVFSQLVLFGAVLNLIAVGAAQSGLIRQAATAYDLPALARIQGAAFLIWAAAAPVLIAATAIASRQISVVLTGTASQWPAVVAVAVLAVLAGPGQIWCSLLSGRKRQTSSLAAQACGLLTGTAAAAWLILRGDAAGAAIAFAAGWLVTVIMALALSGRPARTIAPPFAVLSEVRTLLGYSAAFGATTSFTAAILFALRSVYRASFGPTELGYWMAANRISDMSTQFLGLFMIQLFVPHLATIRDGAARRTVALRSWASGVAVMITALAVFTIASRPLVHIFLSDAYLQAIPAIRVYMTGDCLRVWPSLAMFAAFAAGRPVRYAAIEMGAMTVMAAITLALISRGYPQAPQVGYLCGNAIAAAVVSIGFLWRSAALRSAPALAG